MHKTVLGDRRNIGEVDAHIREHVERAGEVKKPVITKPALS